MNILINYVALFDNRDFLSKSELLFNYNLNSNNNIFAYIVNSFIFFNQTRNFMKISIVLLKRIRFNMIMKYFIDECYQISYKSIELIACK